MKRNKVYGIVLAAFLFCGGCAVTTPKLTEEDVMNRVNRDRQALHKDQEPLGAEISLEEAMARAIKYNLDHRLKIMEDAMAMRQADLSAYDMLPRLVASAGYTERDSYNASSSMNVANHQQSLVPSTSQELGHYSGDLSLTWNILDFGVSYMQSKQQSDRVHIAKERRRKVLHSIMQQVRQAYWLALGAQELEGRFEPLLKEVDKALKDTTRVEEEKLRPPLEVLTYRKTLLEIMKQLETFRSELAQAKPRLASLMNLPPGQSFLIARPVSLDIPKSPYTLEHMELRALLLRPELMEADYNERISISELRKSIARMLPGIELTVGGHFDSTSFLVNQRWVEGGARLTWNLLNIISGSSQYKLAKNQIEIAQAQRLALSMAILTQVHVAYHDYYSTLRQYEISDQLLNIENKIYALTMNQARNGAQNLLNEIRSATSALMASYRSYQNYAALQNAYGQIAATLGTDPLPETVTSHDVKTLTKAISARLKPHISRTVPIPAVPSKPVMEPPAPPVAAIKTAPATAPAEAPQPKAVEAAPLKVEEAAQPKASATVPATTPAETLQPKTVESPAPKVTEAVQPNTASARLCSPTVLSLQFDSEMATLKPEHYAELKILADFLTEFPQATGEIAGHTANMHKNNANNISNIKLSQRRADTIRSYLIKNFGIDPKRITATGYGSSKPVADNNNEENRRKNRRIETNFKCE